MATGPSTRDAILDAATSEFSEHGYSGTRMERVAKRAGCNKALLYRYFGDKDGLFRATLARQFEQRTSVLDRIPEQLAEILIHWFRETASDPHFMRLIQREALNDTGGDVVEQDYRKAYYARQVDLLRDFQARNRVTGDLEADYLFLALLAIVVFPGTFPQITRLATGAAVDSAQFQAGWERMLTSLAGALAPR